MRCLIVDDNGHFLEAARDLLQQEGVTVVATATASTEARLLAADLRPDVILVDVDLGTENGVDLADQLAAESDVAVVLISAYPEAEFTDLITGSSAVGFLSKSELSAAAVVGLLSRRGDRERDLDE